MITNQMKSIKWITKVNIKSKDDNLTKHELRSKLIKWKILDPNQRLKSNLRDHTIFESKWKINPKTDYSENP